MSSENPYAAPEATLIPERKRSDSELADRGTRFVAAFVDGLIAIAYAVPIAYLLGTFEYVTKGVNPPIGTLVASSVLGFIAFLAIHGYFLKRDGQTLGKKMTGIRITNLDNKVPEFAPMILLRYLPLAVVSLIPVIGAFFPFVDVLFIFRKDRRCIHDLLAGTKVIKV